MYPTLCKRNIAEANLSSIIIFYTCWACFPIFACEATVFIICCVNCTLTHYQINLNLMPLFPNVTNGYICKFLIATNFQRERPRLEKSIYLTAWMAHLVFSDLTFHNNKVLTFFYRHLLHKEKKWLQMNDPRWKSY